MGVPRAACHVLHAFVQLPRQRQASTAVCTRAICFAVLCLALTSVALAAPLPPLQNCDSSDALTGWPFAPDSACPAVFGELGSA